MQGGDYSPEDDDECVCHDDNTTSSPSKHKDDDDGYRYCSEGDFAFTIIIYALAGVFLIWHKYHLFQGFRRQLNLKREMLANMSWDNTPRIDVAIRMIDDAWLMYDTQVKEKWMYHSLTLPEYYELRQLLVTVQPRMPQVVAALKKIYLDSSREIALAQCHSNRSLVGSLGEKTVNITASRCSVM